MTYFISNEWLDKQILSINFEKLSDLNPSRQNKENPIIITNQRLENKNESNDENMKIQEKKDKNVTKSVSDETGKEGSQKQNGKSGSDLLTSTTTPTVTPTATPTTTTVIVRTPSPHINTQTLPPLSPIENLQIIKENLAKKEIKEAVQLSNEKNEIQNEVPATTPIEATLISEINSNITISHSASTSTTTINTNTNNKNNNNNVKNGKDDDLAGVISLDKRIEVLEFNMSLSSQYLEKLSQHYRKQLDEMEKAFNLTLTALIDTIRVADERDIKQNDRIVIVEKKLEKMKNTIDTLGGFLNEIKFQTDVIMWTIIIIINLALIIEFINYCSAYSWRKNIQSATTKPENSLKNADSQTQLNNLIDKRLKTLLDQQNYLLNQLKQDKNDLEKKIENLTQAEIKRAPPCLENNNDEFNNQNLIF
jgi:hypothetical protein